MKHKVIVAGSRTFSDYDTLKRVLDYYFVDLDHNDIEIICGCAKGADLLGKKYSNEVLNKPSKDFPAPWNEIENKPSSEIRINKFGKKYWTKAGPFRNKQMGEYGNWLILFWDGKSSGSKNMKSIAMELGLKINEFNYN